MGVLYDYFRAPALDEVRRLLDDTEGESPLGTFDGLDLKSLEPSVAVGQLIAAVLDQEWTMSLVADRLIWPMSAETDPEYDGPWVTVLGDHARDVLAGIPADRVPALATQWATAEEFHGHGDPSFLATVIPELSALASRAREAGESLYCWSSL
ncbi:hypothetical protein [Actinoplanes sp. NBRC 101535]|uniref:hypothetical protein n=1 Tax=Actinoplanes sp. NBRC 101535 TaxID=3032196 RepID=UPI0024A57E5A|nr:hypothetical protein [Actinoplanes sp. NBRC 101535]GLY05890.1 hypothetical protein Acsp01_62690 [Actinoplanes sp. NBRC 101535]